MLRVAMLHAYALHAAELRYFFVVYNLILVASLRYMLCVVMLHAYALHAYALHAAELRYFFVVNNSYILRPPRC